MLATTTKRTVNQIGGFCCSNALNHLLCAAVVNRRFCQQLLKDPISAIESGYLDETFPLSKEEIILIQSIHATSLPDFASCLMNQWIDQEILSV